MNRFLPLLFFLSILVLFLTWLVIGGIKDNPNPLVGKIIPSSDMEFIDSNLKPHTLEELLRNPGYKLINFWASWCLPCEVEHPYLMALKGKNNLLMIGINYKDNEEDAKIFIEDKGNPYDYIGRDNSGFFGIDMGITGVPETFIVDEKGVIVLRHVGPIDFSDKILKP